MKQLLAISGVLGLSLGGCVVPANDRMTIGESVQLEAFTPQQVPAEGPGGQVPERSLKSISRANWASTEILVPVDGTRHTPIYAHRTMWADKAARQRGKIPTALSALELYQGSEEEQEYEALNNHFRAVTDVLLLVPRAIVWAPWKTRASPDEAYQRYWRPERPEPAPTKPGEPPSVSP